MCVCVCVFVCSCHIKLRVRAIRYLAGQRLCVGIDFLISLLKARTGLNPLTPPARIVKLFTLTQVRHIRSELCTTLDYHASSPGQHRNIQHPILERPRGRVRQGLDILRVSCMFSQWLRRPPYVSYLEEACLEQQSQLRETWPGWRGRT